MFAYTKVIAVLLLLAASVEPLHAEDITRQRELFREAKQALSSGKLNTFKTLTGQLESYPLHPYLRYQYLRPRLHIEKAGEIRNYLKTYSDSYLSQRLLRAWLTQLAENKKWSTYLEFYTDQADTNLRCYELQAKFNTGLGIKEDVLDTAKELWLVGHSQPGACDPVFERLYQSPVMTKELLWQRIVLAMDGNKPGLAQYLAKKLDDGEAQWVALWGKVHYRPRLVLRDPALKNKHPIARKIIVHGLKRLASADLEKAHGAWKTLKTQHPFSEDEQGQVARHIALAAAKGNHANTLAWLKQIDNRFVDGSLQRARLRSALRADDWVLLRRWTQAQAHPDTNELQWRYWYARALEKTGHGEAANGILRDLAQQRDYYGFKAADRLGLAYSMQDRPLVLDPAKEAQLMSSRSLARAREFYTVGMELEARLEWNHATNAMDNEGLQYASVLADKWGWYDRAILSLGRANAFDNLAVRFPLAYSNLVSRYAEKRDIEAAYMYSIIRAESAFREDIRSPAGAIGLMQLLPGTGEYIAKKIGYNYRNQWTLTSPKANITLGSAYLREMLRRFDNNMVMASAAYNAGPSRVLSWLPKRQCMAADIWIESLPYTETRRYVRRTLFYTALYEWRMQQKVSPLASRFESIPTRRLLGESEPNCGGGAGPVTLGLSDKYAQIVVDEATEPSTSFAPLAYRRRP